MKKDVFAVVVSCAALFGLVGSVGAQVVDPSAVSDPAAPVTRLGNPYAPNDADFTITAVQDASQSNPLGNAGGEGGPSPQVNSNFEFKGTNGVTYTKSDGKLTDFGIGLYQPVKNGSSFSTGLRIDYNMPVFASSVNVTVLDFDLKPGTATFFNPQKVEPLVVLLSGNTVVGIADPSDIFSALTLVTNTVAPSADTWNLNFSKMLMNMGLADQAITGFILEADQQNGEKANSDPYLLVSVGNGTVVPEPGTIFCTLMGGVILGAINRHRKRMRA